MAVCRIKALGDTDVFLKTVTVTGAHTCGERLRELCVSGFFCFSIFPQPRVG